MEIKDIRMNVNDVVYTINDIMIVDNFNINLNYIENISYIEIENKGCMLIITSSGTKYTVSGLSQDCVYNIIDALENEKTDELYKNDLIHIREFVEVQINNINCKKV